MLPEERYGVIIFLGAVAVVYSLGFAIILRWIFSKVGIGKVSPNSFQIWYKRIVLSLAALGITCIAYGYFVEPYWLSIRNIEIKSSKLPKDASPIRVVHISDLHSDPAPRLEEKLPQVISQQRPDLIVFSGDSINSPDGLPVFRKCLTEIAKIAPTFVVRGNWDAWYWSKEDLFGETGAKELVAASERIEIRGVPLWISGIAVEKQSQITAVLALVPRDEFSLFLYHYPDEIENTAMQNVDLYCAGHTHGGQVALPFYGALVTLSKFGKKYEGGTYKVHNTWLNVNRGIGMEGGNAPRVRFCSRPEVTVIDIVPE